MKFKQFISEAIKRKLGDVVYDFHWDEKRFGYYVTVGGKEVEFFKAKGPFDRSGAQEQAERLIVKLYSEDHTAKRKADEYKYQYEKPLSNLEKEWVELQKRFMKLNDKELKRWEQLHQSGIIRKSLLDDSHPALK
jgi:hypothetical protein